MTALEEHCYYGMVVGKCVGDIVKPIGKIFSPPPAICLLMSFTYSSNHTGYLYTAFISALRVECLPKSFVLWKDKGGREMKRLSF